MIREHPNVSTQNCRAHAVRLTFDTESQVRPYPSANLLQPESMVGRPIVINMKPDTESIKLRVQTTLDDLNREQLIPFKLTAQRVTADRPGNYLVPFYDSRIHSFEFSWTDCDSLSFKDVVRSAVLKRVERMTGPKGWPA